MPTGAPRSPQRTWDEKDRRSLSSLFYCADGVSKYQGNGGASPLRFRPVGLIYSPLLQLAYVDAVGRQLDGCW
jgi:hypothetical protein